MQTRNMWLVEIQVQYIIHQTAYTGHEQLYLELQTLIRRCLWKWYVCIGRSSGKIVTSTDGETWVHQTSANTGAAINKLYYLNNTFIGAGDDGYISYSKNGIDWSHTDYGSYSHYTIDYLPDSDVFTTNAQDNYLYYIPSLASNNKISFMHSRDVELRTIAHPPDITEGCDDCQLVVEVMVHIVILVSRDIIVSEMFANNVHWDLQVMVHI